MSNMKKIIAGLLVIMMVALTGCSGKGSSNETSTGVDTKNAVAVVNDAVIDLDTFNTMYGLYLAQYGEEYMETEVDGVKNSESVKEYIVNSTVINKVIEQYVVSTGYKIDEVALQENIDKFNTSLEEDSVKKGYFETAGATEAFIKDQIQINMYIKAFQDIVYKEASENKTKLDELYASERVLVKARHILLEDQATAQAIKAKLDAGEDFNTLAIENSKDPGSSSEGGDLGYFGRNAMVSEFSKVAFSLEIGAVSDPVQTEHGFHIIKVEDALTVNQMIEAGKTESEINEQKEQIIVALAQQLYVEKIDALKAEAKIETFMEKVKEEKEK